MKQFLLALMILLSNSAWAMDDDGSFRANGYVSCGMYIETRKTPGMARAANLAWVAGYITAYNAWVPDTFDIKGDTDLKSIMLWLDNYCNANPLNDTLDGMKALIIELRPRRYRTEKDAGK